MRGKTTKIAVFIKNFAHKRKSSAVFVEIQKNNLDKTRKFISFAVL